MNTNIKEIKPGIGLGILKFGMNRADVKKILGEPSETEKFSYSDTDEDLVEYWHYDELELSISFEENYDWKLSTISLSSEDYEFKGIKLIGLEYQQLVKTLDSLGVKVSETDDFEELDEEDVLDGRLFITEDGTLSFFIEQDTVTEIQLDPVIVDDEAVIWPE